MTDIVSGVELAGVLSESQDYLRPTDFPVEIVVLDTSVLIDDPEAPFSYGAARVVLPIVVLQELDSLKDKGRHQSFAARHALRNLEALRMRSGGGFSSAVQLESGGTLEIADWSLAAGADFLINHGLDDTNDNRILATTAMYATKEGHVVSLVSADITMRIKASRYDLHPRAHIRGLHSIRTLDREGWVRVELEDAALIEQAYQAGSIAIDALNEDLGGARFVVLQSGSQSAMLKINYSRQCFELLRENKSRGKAGPKTSNAWGLNMNSKEQQFALELLTDPSVQVVALTGQAGTGKTLVTLAAAFEQVFGMGHNYDKISIFRPIIAVGGQDLGYLPGSLEEKLDPWMAAVRDAQEVLSKTRPGTSTKVNEALAKGHFTMESVTFLRGRSLSNTFVIVDEAQNLDRTTLKTVLTRVSAGSKIVLLGDQSQVDNTYLSSESSGLTTIINAFNGAPCFGHVRLTKGERGVVANLAAEML